MHDLIIHNARLVDGRGSPRGGWGNGTPVHDGEAYRDSARPPGQVLTDFAQ